MAEPQHKGPSRVSMLSNILAIAGFIILIVIVIWGLIHLATLSSPWFSSLFDNDDTDATSIRITAPVRATSGENFKVTWKHETDDSGMYAFMYRCQTGLEYSVPTPDGKSLAVPCGAAFAAGTSTKAMTVRPSLTGATSTESAISIVFMPQGEGTQARGDAAVTVVAGTPAPQPAEPKPTQPKPTTPTPSAGPADLSIRITSAVADQFGNAVVTFDIANTGGSSTGSWYFEAQLPTTQPYTYISPAQASLSPGSHIVNTLRYTQATNGSVFISVDPANQVRESNESNNTASQFLGGSAYPTPYAY